MKVCCIYVSLIVYTLLGEGRLPMGILYILSSLKKANFNTKLMVYDNIEKTKNFVDSIDYTPDVFAISIAYRKDVEIITNLLVPLLKQKFPKSKIILGGTGITLASDLLWSEREKNNCIDAICVGEGEVAVVNYLKQVEQDKYKQTDNLFIKDNDGNWLKYNNCNNIENIDEIPYPDIDSWYSNFKIPVKQIKEADVRISRGCPNSCIYCGNQLFRKKSEKNFYRVRSSKSIISEISYLHKKYPFLEKIYLRADSGILSVSHFIDLCKSLIEFNKEVKNKFKYNMQFNFMPDFVNEKYELVTLMKKANFFSICFSVESGDIEVRKKLSRPYYTNENVIEFCRQLKAKNIEYVLPAMYCSIFETRQTFARTIKLLQQCKPSTVVMSYMRTIEATKLYDIMKEKILNNNEITFLEYLIGYIRSFICKPIIYLKYGKFKKAIFAIFEYHTLKEIISDFIGGMKVYNMYKKNILLKEATSNFDNKNFKLAVEYFSRINIDKTNYWIYGDRAVAKMNIGDYEDALKDFDKVLKLEPRESYIKARQECLEKLNKKAV